MLEKLSSAQLFFTAMVSVCIAGSVLAAGNPPPAGQMCPRGAYVTGFDPEGNIVCSDAPESGLPATTEATVQADKAGADACPPGCTSSTAASSSQAAADTTVKDQDAAPNGPVIAKIKPWSVVFGAREATITILGSGFNDKSVVIFQDATYTPSVNAAGTELRVTIETRSLPIGKYAISVSNRAGLATTKRAALEVF
ncbi:MAG TPA: IPT/TIG domain-containing protein [Xanthomonadales bacterium]